MMIRIRHVLISLALAVGVAATGGMAAAVVPLFSIEIDSEPAYYLPKADIVLSSSVPIRWENTTSTTHTITHESCEAGTRCLFDSGSVRPGERYELPGLPPGDYPYFCRVHPIMRGILSVETPETPS
jgi:plastocyanin